ncbi:MULTISPECIES: p-hydroxybenzoic acid efflux pump subunit AaeB [Edwardsiella]|uniref:p-hydroxybenzoic acid efflux subunit AaeB n=2 Tax=Edwardsiella anguillarum TaxID=1821960 RepID=A0A076LGU0_9GAMM|nr:MULTISPECIES: p-hydroxybenzoic acid efflux pump subunit AaeB [Edwardsiella]AIJ07770.1 p-hydroxybenzoic acid efflux subunit AaeB [Edwardsiella anguillarum ET080813]KAB0590182.1 p-hydroxybenzoic acid efflux pump subunit AaeB [Edwardsiella anguillarum]UBU94749.1 p-hydroxybenzoic acid efflux pump subunit AaeB [Edwardsiella sp. LADL05-105]UOU78794.1 p-hydroxybenzoic acid efflux pump subunit AaeB [Edwardsiella anguillarum]WHP83511.1 p-hydroxybenzoic acid efflux pump subunit AaeB [Edwardsiella ang
MLHPRVLHLRFACKLTLAIVLSLLLGFYFGLQTPRWSALTAALVAAGPAFAAGGEPFAGAIRYRGWLRIIGTVLGSLCALLLMMLLIRAPLLMILLCCLWAGVCTWLSSLVRMENAYALGLSGYTALIIVVSCLGEPQFILQLALERCGEIVLGIVCAVLADTLLAPRSIKGEVDRVVGGMLLGQLRLLQRCVDGRDSDAVDRHWHGLIRESHTLEGMRASLALESSRWPRACRRLAALHTLSLTLITRACEIFLTQRQTPTALPAPFLTLIAAPAKTPAEAYQRLKQLRRLLATHGGHQLPPALIGWIDGASQLQLLAKGVASNVRIGRHEAAILAHDAAPRQLYSAQGHHALINGLRTWLATSLGALFWLWSGWNAGSGCMIMIAVVTSLAVRTPNPRMAAIDFLMGSLVALPVGALYYTLILPATQQSLVLLCLSLGALSFICGMEVQKRRLGSLGTLASTLNILVLSNPMRFPIESFVDSAIGQVIGCLLALVVLLAVRDHSRARTGRTLMRRLAFGAVAALRGEGTRGNLLPALYRQLFLLLTLFPDDIGRYRLALTLIVLQQRLAHPALPYDAGRLRAIDTAATRLLTGRGAARRRGALLRLTTGLSGYADALARQGTAAAALQPLYQLADVLHRYRGVLLG